MCLMWKDEREILENQDWLDTELNIDNNTITVSILYFYRRALAQCAKASFLATIYD
jgi:hypothetical protein